MDRGANPLPPEDADSEDEFRARRAEEDAAVRTRPGSARWSSRVWLLIPASIGLGSAVTLKGNVGLAVRLVTIVAITVGGVMIARAMRRAERQRSRTIELDRLQSLWEKRLNLRSPTL